MTLHAADPADDDRARQPGEAAPQTTTDVFATPAASPAVPPSELVRPLLLGGAAVLVLLVLVHATGAGGLPRAQLVVPLAVSALTCAALAALLRRLPPRRGVLVALIGAAVAAAAAAGLTTLAPPGPDELERRVRAMAGDDVELVRVEGTGGLRCDPCAEVQALLRVPAPTVDAPLVLTLRRMRERGLATSLGKSRIRPDTSTARGRGPDVQWSLRVDLDPRGGTPLTALVSLRVVAQR